MNGEISHGYVGLFEKALTDETIRLCVDSWLARFEKVEQACPGAGAGALTMAVNNSADVLNEEHLQFRVLMGGDFAWIYLTKNRRIIETTGLPNREISLCLDALLELPGILEIIDQRDDRRLDQLEAEGLM